MTKISRDGYSFNQNDTIWILNKDKINKRYFIFGQLIARWI